MSAKSRTVSSRALRAVIWYRPRLRFWIDKQNDCHLAGEPDGFRELLKAFRFVYRRVADQMQVNLISDAIPLERNPVSDRGVRRLYRGLHLVYDDTVDGIHIHARKFDAEIAFNIESAYALGFAIVEAMDGEGDFCISARMQDNPTLLWFWGYSNPHGVNTF